MLTQIQDYLRVQIVLWMPWQNLTPWQYITMQRSIHMDMMKMTQRWLLWATVRSVVIYG